MAILDAIASKIYSIILVKKCGLLLMLVTLNYLLRDKKCHLNLSNG
tara:strand:- start:356 stop:493 length:138 start_codon:yes stop_codon:yes gene_type:complete